MHNYLELVRLVERLRGERNALHDENIRLHKLIKELMEQIKGPTKVKGSHT